MLSAERAGGEGPPGIWILEGIPLAGKTTLLRRWRTGNRAPVLWSAEDFASQRLFEPLDSRHTPAAVTPWLTGMVDAWAGLQSLASATHLREVRFGFAAHQERFHLSAILDGGLAEADFAALEARLADLGARGVLLCLDEPELQRRLEASLAERPPTWPAWLQRRYGGPAGAAAAFLERQSQLLKLAEDSCLAWLQGPA